MNKLSLAFAVGSLGSLFLGLTQGCGTNEVRPGGGLLPDAGDSGVFKNDGSVTNSSRTPFGRACLKDADCGGGGITCVTSGSKAFDGGGPANGMCSADCSADQTLCARLDPNSICVLLSSAPLAAYCLQGCTAGAAQIGDEKCHARSEVACGQLQDSSGNAISSSAGACFPQCRNDVDCGTRKCDLGSGFCKDAADVIGTLPIGSACDAGLIRDLCVGRCEALNANDAGTGPGECVGLCPLGSATEGCGNDPTGKAPPAAACLFGSSASSGQGDIGFCGQLCDCKDDCQKTPGLTCRPFVAADAAAFHRPGYCGNTTDSTTGKAAESIPCKGHRDAGSTHSDSGSAPDSGDAGRDAR